MVRIFYMDDWRYSRSIMLSLVVPLDLIYMDTEIKKVKIFTRIDKPSDDDTIETDFKLDLMAPDIIGIDVYFYEPDVIENFKAQWVIDIVLNDDSIFRVRLPKEMTEKQVRAFIQPLFTLMNQSNRDLH